MAVPDELLAELDWEEDSSEEAAEPAKQLSSEERPGDIADCRSYPSRCALALISMSPNRNFKVCPHIPGAVSYSMHATWVCS